MGKNWMVDNVHCFSDHVKASTSKITRTILLGGLQVGFQVDF